MRLYRRQGFSHQRRAALRLSVRTLALAFGVALVGSPLSALADDHSDAPQPQYGWREVWGGVDATKDVWLLYTGVTLAPLSKDIYSDGLRFRANSGYGQYHYDYHRQNCVDHPAGVCRTTINVDVTYTDLLVGYHMRLDELTAKAFAGASMVSHDFSTIDPTNDVRGRAFGASGALEFWLNLGDRGWTSLDLFYTTAHSTGSARWRAGWRVLPTLSIGPEVRYDRNAEDDASRVGTFARYEWLGGETSVSAGFAGSMTGGTTDDMEPYITLNMLSQF
ncbi:MAG: cellulose biosynthesis protein BcsS [Hyphomicrobium sp.]|jgi:hypothetical protein|nr:cellulose biosynthesis protein BcsS [Hyphomicrobium sp.]